MLRLIDEYSNAHSDDRFRMRDVATWAFHHKKWRPQPSHTIKDLARRLARAAEKKRHTDPQGRRVRSLHAANYPRMEKNGQLIFETIWDYMQTMSAEHARVSFTQRWHQLAGGCRSLKIDVDSFNENSPRAIGQEIQLSFNFDFELDAPTAQVVETVSGDDGTQAHAGMAKSL